MSATPKPRGYTASREQTLVRLARIEGQVRGIARMVQEDRDCIDVITQIGAIQAALDKVSLALLDGHARECLTPDSDAQAQVEELMEAVGRMLGR